MIIVRLSGGLGNQMFQYAFGRNLALRKKTELRLDLSTCLGKTFKTGTPRNYRMGVFKIKENFCTPDELKKVKNGELGVLKRAALWLLGKELPLHRVKEWKNAALGRFLGKEKPFYAQPIVNERHYYVYDKDILKVGRNVFLQGYWNNEKYFKDIEGLIRKEFEFKRPPVGKNKELIKKIRECDSVSLHVRRGDYVTDYVTKKLHGTFTQNYYQQAVKTIADKIKNPDFFVFSDDIEWAKKNIKLKHPTTFVDNNDGDYRHHYEDMRLMSACKHNIIANSSFSWWGAWLNANPDKIVIAPQKWLNDPEIDTSDVIPKSWLRI